jgi:hypothetical protein
MIDRPGNYQLGSIESRTAARAMLDRIQTRQKNNVVVVRIEHIGHDGKEPLPLSQRIPWGGGVTEIIHVAGGSL